LLQRPEQRADLWNMITALESERSTTGPMMRHARELAGLRLGRGASVLGIGWVELRAIERGRRSAPRDVLERAIEAYGDIELMLPPRQDLIRYGDPTCLVVGEEVVRLDPGRNGNEGLLCEYVAAVRRQRGLDVKAPVAFRAHDLVQLAGVLDLGTVELERQLAEVAGLPSDPARRAARTLVLTGLCLVVAGMGSAVLASGEMTWLSGDLRADVPPSEVSSRLGELEELMAQLRSAT